MTNKTFMGNYFAASEVIGAIILVLIAIGAFAAIYLQVFPVQLPSPDPHVKLAGTVTDEGQVVLIHVGGEVLTTYEIHVEQSDGSHTYRFENEPWEIGGRYYPPMDNDLFNQEKQVKISVYDVFEDGSTKCVFDGIITPKEYDPGPGTNPLSDPMSISTLRTNTVDEDLICYSYSIEPNIVPTTFIYNWMVATTGPYHSLTRLLMPFDTQNPFRAKDYSGNFYNGTINGATWTNTGKLGGAYQFTGDDFIAIPYCFEDTYLSTITVEAWVKTSLPSGTIISYDREKYCELSIVSGKVKWSTNASDGIVDLLGTSMINNGNWHYLVTTYDSETGEGSIYIDGRLDIRTQVHGVGSLLGSGYSIAGALGKSVSNQSRKSIFSTSFETPSEKNNWSENNSDAAIGIMDYVDNNLSDDDRSSDKGTHSNFENEKNIGGGYDVLTEGNTAETTTTTLLIDGFDMVWDSKWNEATNNWFQSSDQKHSGTYSAKSDNGNEGDFICDDVVAIGASSILVDFWYRLDDTEDTDLRLYYYDGSSWDFKTDLGGGTEDSWRHYTETITDPQYFKSNFKVRFYSQIDDNDENVWVDDVQIVIVGTDTTFIDGFEVVWDSKWNEASNNWFQSSDQKYSGTYSAKSDNGDKGDFICDDVVAIGASSILVDFWYRLDDTEDTDLRLYYYDGSSWDPIISLGGGAENTWLHYTYTITDPQYFKSNFKIRFDSEINSDYENVWVDDVQITKTETPDIDYELDLEIQWTNVNYQLPGEQLCIYAGSFSGSENIAVDVWTGSNWITVFNPLLPSQWNNVSITNWLTSSTFTIRYRDGNPTNDITIDSWNIDATLLHLWTPKGVFDIFPSTTLTPHSGSYSIGGSGDFDPDYDAYNRTGIDISNYKNVTVSVWFSYKNTVSNDFLGLYYLNSTVWLPIFEINNPQIGGGQQLPWTYVEAQIPNSIHNLVLQFKWRTSSTTEYVAIDDLNITGIPSSSEGNFTGVIDEVKIYPRVLTPEQVYQNYLCTKDGDSSRSVLVSEEICIDQIWKCLVTPNDGLQDDVVTESNILYVINYGGGG